jgi:O-antigen/teichoic acid export membrane protein
VYSNKISHYKKVHAGIKSDLIIFLISTILGFILIPIYLAYLTMTEFGIFVAVQSLVALSALTDIGMGLYVTKKLSSDDYCNKNSIEFLSSMQIFQYLMGCALLIIGLIAYYFIDNLLNIDGIYSSAASLLFLLSWFSIVIQAWFALNNAVLRAKGELAYINVINFAIFLLTGLLNIIFLYLDYGIVSLGVSLVISTFFVNLIMLIKVKREYDILLIFPHVYMKEYIAEGWAYVKKFQILKIAQLSKTSLFTVLLAYYSGTSIVAQYNITNKIPLIFPGLMSRISLNYFTRFASLYEENKIDSLRGEYEKLFIFGFKSAIFILLSLYFLNELFVSVWVGADKYIGYYIFIVMLMNIGVLLLVSFTGLIIQISGEFHKMPILSAIEVILLLITTYIFFNIFDTIGIFLALFFSSLPALFYSLYVVKKILGLNYHKLLMKQVPNIFLMVVSITITNYAINYMLSNNIATLVLLSLLFFIIFSSIQLYYSSYTLKIFIQKVIK